LIDIVGHADDNGKNPLHDAALKTLRSLHHMTIRILALALLAGLAAGPAAGKISRRSRCA
jgi:hypothetical protein